MPPEQPVPREHNVGGDLDAFARGVERVVEHERRQKVAYAASPPPYQARQEPSAQSAGGVNGAGERTAWAVKAATMNLPAPMPLSENDMSDREGREQAVAKALAGLDVSQADLWRAQLHTWEGTGKWDTVKLGPAPGKPGCRVPTELIRAKTVAHKANPLPASRAAESEMHTVGDMMARFEESCRRAGLLRAA
jgi:hypothetical protein